MKTFMPSCLALMFLAAGAAHSAPPVPQGPAKAYSQTSIKPADYLKPESAADLKAPLSEFQKVEKAIADLKVESDKMYASSTYYRELDHVCKNKSYSSDEIQRVCGPNDTVHDCSGKLYLDCMKPASNRRTGAAQSLFAARDKVNQALSDLVRASMYAGPL